MKLRQKQFGARDCVPQRFRVCEGRMYAPATAGTDDALRAFTLVELIVVMTLLVTVIALASPSLAGFFRGRAVDAEARRFMSLTRLGQSRAAPEGVPMILWVDTANAPMAWRRIPALRTTMRRRWNMRSTGT
jgi:prepilin-type N-terminal cleavage/methylation domain-containing protein